MKWTQWSLQNIKLFPLGNVNGHPLCLRMLEIYREKIA